MGLMLNGIFILKFYVEVAKLEETVLLGKRTDSQTSNNLRSVKCTTSLFWILDSNCCMQIKHT